MSDLNRKIDFAIKLLQSIPQDGPIELCYSTGKDSDVILELAKMSGIPFVPIYKNTTCDQPGSIEHARELGVEIRQPKKNMLKLIEENGWPSRWSRFCCKYLKEYKIYDRAILGIRRFESAARAKRYKEPERCRVYNKDEKARQYLPILEWTNNDVEQFIDSHRIKCHPHYYDESGCFHVERRVGCIGCPLATGNGRLDYKKFPNVLKARIVAYNNWFLTHPNSKTVRTFPSVYHAIFMKLFCHDMGEYYQYVDRGQLFDNEIVNPKEFLESYFNIDLTI